MMEVGLDIYPAQNLTNVFTSELLPNQEKPNSEEPSNIPADTFTLSTTTEQEPTLYSLILNSARSDTIMSSEKIDLISAAMSVEDSLLEIFAGFDEATADVLSSAVLRLAVEGMDEYSIWRATDVEVGMAGIRTEDLAKAWAEKTKEMGLKDTFELSREDLLSVVDELTRGKELKVMNYLMRGADIYLTGAEREMYLNAHRTIFKGATTEEEKWNMIADEEGLIDPKTFVIGLRAEAIYRTKPDVKELTKDEIMVMVNEGVLAAELEELPELAEFVAAEKMAEFGEKVGEMAEEMAEKIEKATAKVKKAQEENLKALKEKIKAKLQKLLNKISPAAQPEGEAQETVEQGEVSGEVFKDRNEFIEDPQLNNESTDSSQVATNQQKKQNNGQPALSGHTPDTFQGMSQNAPEPDNNPAISEKVKTVLKTYSKTTSYFETNIQTSTSATLIDAVQ
ncbi:MAG: hypothetical protein QME81_16500 [bacterium]|nr:hypothetical protein [bacterium]